MSVEKGLIVRAPWAQALVTGAKTWELRNRPTQVRETIAILEGGSCLLRGAVDIVDCIGPLGPADLKKAVAAGHILPEEIHDADHAPVYAWVVENPVSFEPLRYRHPRGAVTWVRMEGDLGCMFDAAVSSVRRTRPSGPR